MFLTVNLAQNRSKISNYISDTLLEHIDSTLEKGEKVMLYLNKRGSHSSLICEDCQHLYSCPNCDVSLSVHSNPQHLRCHICNHAFNVPTECSKCHKNTLKAVGVGTQQIENVLREYYKEKSLSKSQDSSLNLQNATSDTSLNLSCQERNSCNNNVVGNYYEIPDYIKVLVKELRIKQTKSENILWEVLRAKRFNNLKFRRQHPFGRYIADFYCDNLKLVIELDGEIHEKTKEYDKIRDEIISQYGVYVLRINNSELENIPGVLEKIAASSLLAGENGERCLVNKREFKSEVKGKLTKINSNLIKTPTIYRFDSDSMKNISSKREALKHLDSADIIIGTKMLTTGFNFEKIGLICILLVESELSYPSYDASEKAYTNLRQLIGRGNRKSQQTTIILQTFIPKHPLVAQLTSNNFKDFFQETLLERKEFDYPPYKQMVTLEYRHKDSKKSLAYTQKLLEDLQKIDTQQEYIFLRGSSTFRKNNTHHATLIVKGKNVRKLLKHIEKTIISQSAFSVIFH